MNKLLEYKKARLRARKYFGLDGGAFLEFSAGSDDLVLFRSAFRKTLSLEYNCAYSELLSELKQDCFLNNEFFKYSGYVVIPFEGDYEIRYKVDDMNKLLISYIEMLGLFDIVLFLLDSKELMVFHESEYRVEYDRFSI
jgi:hypothetical protein